MRRNQRTEETSPRNQQIDKRSNTPKKKNFHQPTSDMPSIFEKQRDIEAIKPILEIFRDPLRVQPLSAVSLHLNAVDTSAPEFVQNFKFTDDRSSVTALVKLGGSNWVIKARTQDVADHVVNSKLLRALSIEGVRAPITEKLSPEDAIALGRKLKSAGTSATMLATALKAGDASYTDDFSGESTVNGNQISELAPPSTSSLAGLLLSVSAGTKPLYIALENIQLNGGFGQPEVAIIKLLGQIGRPVPLRYKDNPDDWNKILQDLGGSPELRKARIKELKDALPPLPSEVGRRVEQPLDERMRIYVGLLEAKEAGGLANLVGEWRPHFIQKQEVVQKLQSPKGVFDLAAIATVDLLVGMEDRIVRSFAPDNLHYDPRTGDLWCIDNAKDPGKGLMNVSDRDDKKWSAFIGQQITKYAPELADSSTISPATVANIINRLICDNVFADRGIAKLGQPVMGEDAMMMVITHAVDQTLAGLSRLASDTGLQSAAREKLASRLGKFGYAVGTIGAANTTSPANSSPRPTGLPKLPDVQQLPRAQPVREPTPAPIDDRAATSPSVPQLRRAPRFGEPTPAPIDDRAATSPSVPQLRRAPRFGEPTPAPIDDRAATSPSVPQLRRAPRFGGPTLTPNDDGAAISPAHGNITSPRPSRPQLPLLPDLPQDVGPSPQLRISPISPRGATTSRGPGDAQPQRDIQTQATTPQALREERVRRPIGGTQPRVAILQNPRTYESPPNPGIYGRQARDLWNVGEFPTGATEAQCRKAIALFQQEKPRRPDLTFEFVLHWELDNTQ